MNKCKVCGQECGIYEICRECQKDIEHGKVKMCPSCKKYYITEKGHTCQNHTQQKNESNSNYTENEYEDNGKEEKSTFRKAAEGTAGVGCGCAVAAALAIGIFAILFFIAFKSAF